ncbi:hypothetical protein SO694_0019004 [Aureococcus anophagefferens]|uniref:FAD/NAD(P)-binding domain-containing protein n=1 Tax=Aureococcus anophagefferens TaxID=44056 RepID=A0ABR1FP49_AURAN
MARRAAYDYVVVGGGFAGLNAVSGLQKFRPAAPAHLDGVSDGSAEEVECAALPDAVAARGEETLYVVVGGGKTGADAVCFLGEHRRRGDDVLLVTGSSKGFFVRDEVFPDQGSQSVFQPMITEVMLDMIAAWDGTDASERDILNDMVARGTLCSLGGSEVANTGLGVLSRAEQAAVEATAEIVANDHYVGVSARGATTEVRLASGGAVVTRKRVVVVNARSSGSDRVHAYNSDVHPLRPEGHLDFGALAGFTGHTNYLFSAVLAKHGSPRVLEGLALYGRRTRARPRENFVFAYLVKVYANITALMPALEMKHYLSSDYSINATRWYPTARRLYGVYRLLQSRDAVAAMADAHLRRLEPGDAQPPPEGA